jgi:hypothetical protein
MKGIYFNNISLNIEDAGWNNIYLNIKVVSNHMKNKDISSVTLNSLHQVLNYISSENDMSQ